MMHSADAAVLDRLARAHGLTKAEILKAAAALAERKRPMSDRMAVGEG